MTRIPLARLDAILPPALQTVWKSTAQLAETHGWELYLVGGAVRDLILRDYQGTKRALPTLPDLDLVVSSAPQTPTGAGILLAQDLHARYPNTRLTIHETFQTAAITWLTGAWAGMSIDLATARTETYPYPGANPTVTAGSIYQDLQRRDFTINAMALRLSGAEAGEIIDFFGGMVDLQATFLRVLHDHSLADDPTRLWRGVRFLTRLNLTWAPETLAQWRENLRSGVYTATLAAHDPVPALQTRLLAELKYLASSPQWLAGVEALAALQAWQLIHPHLVIDRSLRWRLRYVEHWRRHPWPGDFPAWWLVRLEVVLGSLSLADRSMAVQQLQLPVTAGQRLSQIDAAMTQLKSFSTTSTTIKPSQVVAALQPFAPGVLLQVGLQVDRQQRRLIWQYLTNWSLVTCGLNGRDLQALGYPPGATYKVMLQTLTAATLDGLVGCREDAVRFLHDRFPVPGKNS